MKIKEKGIFIRVETVMEDLQISRPMAYKCIAAWNNELKEMGYLTISGRVPKAFYEKKIYGNGSIGPDAVSVLGGL